MLRIAFRLPADEKEKVLDALMPLLPTGVREEPLEDGTVGAVERGDRGDAALAQGARGRGRADLGGLRDGAGPGRLAGARRARFGGGSYVLGDRLVVRSPWDPPAPEGMLEVVIERTGNAFGSGSHPTTQMCLALLLDLPVGEGGVADLGCGIGTLGIAAARLGWSPVAALDRVEAAVESARANAQRNGVEMECAVADLEAEGYPARELLLVNAPPPVHEHVAAQLTSAVRQVIASGIVGTEVGPVRDAYAAAGLEPAAGFEDDAWAALRFERRA